MGESAIRQGTLKTKNECIEESAFRQGILNTKANTLRSLPSAGNSEYEIKDIGESAIRQGVLKKKQNQEKS